MKIIEGGVTTPKGFKATGIAANIKKGSQEGKKDLALIFSETPATAAGAFTQNIVRAAPVDWCERILESDIKINAMVSNSGNANACTGELGIKHVEQTAEKVANLLNINKDKVIICSTGVIGVPLPIDTLLKGIETIIPKLSGSAEDGHLAAEAIMTTDTFPKEIAVEIDLNGKKCYIGGICKGSGMIHPNMATMLGFITTDVNISKDLLRRAVKEGVKKSFNMISVDRDTSTNDQVTVMANGLAENPLIDTEGEEYQIFKDALDFIQIELAKMIAKDGEGATKLIAVHVQGAKSLEDARVMSRSVTTSNLTKAAFFGEDANWGRVLAAMGYSGAYFDPKHVNIKFVSKGGSIDLMIEGTPQSFDEDLALTILKEKEITVEVLLKDGEGEATAWGCDLSYDYVKINGDYRT